MLLADRVSLATLIVFHQQPRARPCPFYLPWSPPSLVGFLEGADKSPLTPAPDSEALNLRARLKARTLHP